jgi:hypothetical protein
MSTFVSVALALQSYSLLGSIALPDQQAKFVELITVASEQSNTRRAWTMRSGCFWSALTFGALPGRDLSRLHVRLIY